MSTGATSPPGPGLWKRAQTPIKELAMATIHRHQTTATPEPFLLLSTGGKRVLANALAKTVKAIENRNYQPRQAQS
jgi:hypothetical protein